MFYSEVHSERKEVLAGKREIHNQIRGGKKITMKVIKSWGRDQNACVISIVEILRTQLPMGLKNLLPPGLL